MKILVLLILSFFSFSQSLSFQKDGIYNSSLYNQKEYVFFSTSNLSNFDIFVYHIDNIFAFLKFFNQRQQEEELDRSVLKNNTKLLASSKIYPKSSSYTLKLKDIIDSTQDNDDKFYLIRASYKVGDITKNIYKIKILSDIGAVVNRGFKKTVVSVFDIKTAQNISGARVDFYKNKNLIKSIFTNEIGFVSYKNTDFNLVKISYFPDKTFIPISQAKKIQDNYFVKNNIFFGFDKQIYNQGDNVNFVIKSNKYSNFKIIVKDEKNNVTNFQIENQNENYNIKNISQGVYSFSIFYDGDNFLQKTLIVKSKNKIDILANNEIALSNSANSEKEIKGYLVFDDLFDKNYSFKSKNANLKNQIFDLKLSPNETKKIPIKDYPYPAYLFVDDLGNKNIIRLNSTKKFLGIKKIRNIYSNTKTKIPIIALINNNPTKIGKVYISILKQDKNSYKVYSDMSFESQNFQDYLDINIKEPGSYMLELNQKDTSSYVKFDVLKSNALDIISDKKVYSQGAKASFSYNTNFSGASFNIFYVNGKIVSSYNQQIKTGKNNFFVNIPKDSFGASCFISYVLREYQYTSSDRQLFYKNRVCFFIKDDDDIVNISENKLNINYDGSYIVGFENANFGFLDNTNLNLYDTINVNLQADSQINKSIDIKPVDYSIFYKNTLLLYNDSFYKSLYYTFDGKNSIDLKAYLNNIFIYLIDKDKFYFLKE